MAKPKSKKNAEVFSVPDLFGNLVTLRQQTWVEHIIDPDIGHHPGMAGYENLVKDTIQSPYQIKPCTDNNTRFAYCSSPLDGPEGTGIHVLVQMDSVGDLRKGNLNGTVITSYDVYPNAKHHKLGTPVYAKPKMKDNGK